MMYRKVVEVRGADNTLCTLTVMPDLSVIDATQQVLEQVEHTTGAC